MKYKSIILTLIFASLILTGCSDTGKASGNNDTAPSKKIPVERPASDNDSEKTEAGSSDSSDTSETEAAASGQRSDIKTAFTLAINNFHDKHLLPDGRDVSQALNALGEDISNNHFAVYDIDGDNKEELIISVSATDSADMFETAYGYDENTGKLYEELNVNPYTEYYTYGFLKEMASHNQGVSGDFWPYTLHKFNDQTGRYEAIAYIEAWDGNNYPKDMDGNSFPSQYDKDKDGMIYYLTECHEPYDRINEEPYDYPEFSNWLHNEMSDKSGKYPQYAYSFTPTWQYFTNEAIEEYENSSEIITGINEDFFTKFTVKDMDFYMSNDFLDKVITEELDDGGFAFYHKKSEEAFREEYPDSEYMGGDLFTITALTDDYEVDDTYSFDYYGSSPSTDGKTEYYNYVAFTPTDWPAMGDGQSIDEYRDLSLQYKNIHETIKDCIIFDRLPNYRGDENTYVTDIHTESTGQMDKNMAEAYNRIASKPEYSYENEMGSFALEDLNADGIMELMIDPDGMIVSENLYFTYRDGKAIELDASKLDIPVYGSLLTSSKSGTFCFYRGGPACEDEEGKEIMPHMYIEYSIINDKIYEGDSYLGINYIDDDSWDYDKNGKSCTSDNYNNFVRSMDKEIVFTDNTPANRKAKGLE
ncbi:MAG: hypothetical protein K6E98_09360 [Lachnospiraceae bacterium]|nr:hypothetical protein [Lachnospiraceae bacterium]